MPRPRTRTREEMVAAAKDAFWEFGYDGTAVSELERRTGVNRSSLYAEFGSKQALFAESLDMYDRQIVDPLIAGMEADPSFGAIEAFFGGVKDVILEERTDRRRGCLLVNAIAELSPHEPDVARRGVEFRDRLLRAFMTVLEQEAAGGRGAGSVERRANMLLATILGIWVCARIDLEGAARQCDEAAAEVRDWASASRARRRS
jgi:TetR/AcrR family transcriptional regulator, transcriptional repressor for nem operon